MSSSSSEKTTNGVQANSPQDYTQIEFVFGNVDTDQGNRTSSCGKSGPNAVEDGLIPACAEALAANVVFDGLVSL